MSEPKKPAARKNGPVTLRGAAEMKLARIAGATPGQGRSPLRKTTGKSAESILREVQVHQIELERQNKELKLAQAAVEKSRDKYQHLYDFAPAGYFTLTRTGQVAEANLAGAAMLGVDRTKLMHHNLERFIASPNHDLWRSYLVRVLNSDERQICELTLTREDGFSFDACVDSIRLVPPGPEARNSGRGTVIRLVVSDISNLAQTHRKLAEALADLARSNVELENFGYAVSHDLKGPLVTITGFLGRLAVDVEQGDAMRIHSDIARIVDATGKMDWLLRDLLELSRIGRAAVCLEDVPLMDLAREVVNLLDGPITERGVRIEISPHLPTVYGARVRLVQLFMNLIVNAVKFMGEQPDPHVTIGVRRDGKETVLYVRDNGIGIEPQHLERVFGLFRQLDPGRGGTGIGLALARRVVETHRGRIWIESDGLGKGSTFCFSLPGRVETIAPKEQGNEPAIATCAAG